MSDKVTHTEGLPEDLQSDATDTDGVPDHKDTAYTPVFDVRIRTVVYAVAGMLGVIGSCLGVIGAVAGTPAGIAVAGSVLGILGSGTAGVFGVHYAGASR